MNFARQYELLIEKRRKNPLSRADGYCERHHFIPKCMGGGNEFWNLIYLTAKEHFVAHHLLCKANPGNGKLLNAFIAMCTKQNQRQGERELYISARRYEELKSAYGAYRRRVFAIMPEEKRAQRRANIKAGCARRTPEQKAAIKAKRDAYFAALTEEDKKRIHAKRIATISNRTEARKREIFEAISRAHRKMSEQDELRVVAEYQKGKSASEIASEAWCSLGREGVNYLLRRRGIPSHHMNRWAGKEELICHDYLTHKYMTNSALAAAYGTCWSTIHRILSKNRVQVAVSKTYSQASIMREDARLRTEFVEYASPFAHTTMSSSLYDAIERLRMFGLISCATSRRKALQKIRRVIEGRAKYAYGYEWKLRREHNCF